MFGLFIRVLERGKFLCNKMAELVAEVEESVVDGFSFDRYTGIISWVENILGDPGATSRDDAIFLGESLL